MKHNAEYVSKHGDDPLPRSRRTGGTTDSEFVNIDLSKEQKDVLRVSYTDTVDLDAVLLDIMNDGTKITMKWEERSNGVAVFAFGSDTGDNQGYILTGRGASASRALRQLAYKHHDLLEGQWADWHNRVGESDEDDW